MPFMSTLACNNDRKMRMGHEKVPTNFSFPIVPFGTGFPPC